ncbi:hypothetical protein A3D42_03365 [Candidatus Nomurabacteria bacterium RIFCSPHIGHO2_02_FULL_41_18]|uniref:Secreted protein n=1 Tax=Candidatus Nomurabacteria bacterium RIFCSPHIGHO2_02_FULL_41_18 TaxID=1801754 RepID=A0A1F6W7Q7_9BACT|nr:MAG: hypothetical protein A2737_00195 [Candidatus Nomurabacteria bacterium RIFCSPHIGHO2_01_FULL_41_71]OGI77921.1 MAG: hypothetical protein A3D42_03365 [Candidatus Nomurabacteria bacterium RIFCSPHIGHO2_02_FULL_41_18]OGI90336.1 MAG: hypothetical protein A3B01_01280 [Candidatus Nomurabacteria bacterium RIFCSPLOWO2_01_FULL_41_52b]
MAVAVLLSLTLFLCGNGGSALATFHNASKCKFVGLFSRRAFSAEKYLHSIVFFGGNHWFVRASIPVTTFSRPLKHAVIKRVGEHIKHSSLGNFNTPASIKLPVISSYFPNISHGMRAGQH